MKLQVRTGKTPLAQAHPTRPSTSGDAGQDVLVQELACRPIGGGTGNGATHASAGRRSTHDTPLMGAAPRAPVSSGHQKAGGSGTRTLKEPTVMAAAWQRVRALHGLLGWGGAHAGAGTRFGGVFRDPFGSRQRRCATVSSPDSARSATRPSSRFVSLIGLTLIVLGFAKLQLHPGKDPQLWVPPLWTRHIAIALMLPAMIALVAAYVPSHIHTALKHPMLVAIKIWALAHLLANGDLGRARAVRQLPGVRRLRSHLGQAARRARAAGAKTGPWINDVIVLVLGTGLYVAILLWLHQWLDRRVAADMSGRRAGRLIGIAVRAAHRAPMQTRNARSLSVGGGVEGDYKGAKHPRRGVTVLAREDWEAALAELGEHGAEPSRGRRGAPTCWSKALSLPRAIGRHRAHRAGRDRGHLSDDAVQAHGRGACRTQEGALSRLARRHHRPRRRRRARGTGGSRRRSPRRPSARSGCPAERAEKPRARLARPRW